MADDGAALAEIEAPTPEVDTLERLQALKDGDTFLVADGWGDLKGGADGLFDDDTRILSRLELKVGGARPSRLSAGVSRDNVYFTCHSTNRPLPPMGGRSAPAGVIHIERRRFVRDRRLFERVRLTNHGVQPVTVPLTYEFGADFADIFQVRGSVRERTGTSFSPIVSDRAIDFSYLGLDGVTRASRLVFSQTPETLSPSRADFVVNLGVGARVDLFLECGDALSEIPSLSRWRTHAVEARLAMRRRRRRGAGVRAPNNRLFNAWLDQSRADMALLTTDLETGPYPYAGVPWFSTPFGRDGILSAWQMLWLDPSLARGVLTYLARRQATETDAFRDSQPGKIMHETRRGEMSVLGEVPFGLYYGGVDTTCLFVALAGAYAKRTGDLKLIQSLWPNLVAAVGWMRDHGDSNGDGLIDYQRASDTGLSNQGWKDSEDSIFHGDGHFPKGPIALLEVQGYAHAAWLAMADLADRIGDDRAREWRRLAEEVRTAIQDRFWMPDQGFYAIALDGNGDPCEAIGSNAGHLLFTGSADAERAALVSRRLLSPEFRTGWGLRTLAKGQPRFNPMSYHNGSVWPHDTSLAVAGMARYGERDAAALLLGELYDAATHFSFRLPELFCGFEEQTGEPPIAYPVACLPQAWAAGSVFLMLQAALGLSIDAFDQTIQILAPTLPTGIDRLVVTDIRVGEASVSLAFQRVGDQVAVLPFDKAGPIRILTTR